MSYKKPFSLCPDQCILVHLQSHHFKGCPQQPWEEGKACIVLPLWEMQERGPGREGVDGSSISVALHQALLFSLWWGFERLFQRGKSVKIQATRPVFARGQEEYKCTNGQGSRGLTAGKMCRAGRTAHPCARGPWLVWWGPLCRGRRPTGPPPPESRALGSRCPPEHLSHVKGLRCLERS